MKKAFSLSSEQKIGVEKIAKRFKLELIMVFGSFASGKNRADSDLDIAVLAKSEISFEKQIKLSVVLAEIFGKDVDLSVMNRANPLHLYQVSENSILLFGSDEDYFRFRLKAFRMYHDYAPYFAMERDLNKKIIDAYGNR